MSTGARYEVTKNLRLTEIAALIREDIKAATKRGDLPRDLKISVKTRLYSGGGSIDVEVTAAPFAIHDWAAVTESDLRPVPYLPDAWRVLTTLRTIWDAYNYDRSDMMSDHFDVRYYGTVGFASALRWPKAAGTEVQP